MLGVSCMILSFPCCCLSILDFFVCLYVCLFVLRGYWSDPNGHCEGGWDPELEIGRDQRELAFQVPKEVYYSSVSADRSGLLAVVPMALVSARQSLDFFHPLWRLQMGVGDLRVLGLQICLILLSAASYILSKHLNNP